MRTFIFTFVMGLILSTSASAQPPCSYPEGWYCAYTASGAHIASFHLIPDAPGSMSGSVFYTTPNGAAGTGTYAENPVPALAGTPVLALSNGVILNWFCGNEVWYFNWTMGRIFCLPCP